LFLDKLDTVLVIWPGFVFQAAAQNRSRPLYIPFGDADAGQTRSALPPLPLPPTTNPPRTFYSPASNPADSLPPARVRAMVSGGGRGYRGGGRVGGVGSPYSHARKLSVVKELERDRRASDFAAPIPTSSGDASRCVHLSGVNRVCTAIRRCAAPPTASRRAPPVCRRATSPKMRRRARMSRPRCRGSTRAT
jgi:hypothetical protein